MCARTELGRKTQRLDMLTVGNRAVKMQGGREQAHAVEELLKKKKTQPGLQLK